MSSICNAYGTPAWQAAHYRRISESDVPTILGRPGTAAWRFLVDRLAADFSDVPREPGLEERQLAYRARFLPDIRAAIARYSGLSWHARRPGRVIELPGMYAHDQHTWLVSSPHAIAEDHIVHVCCHVHRRAWEQQERRGPPPATAARLQIAMHVTGRPRAEIINFWSSGADWHFDKWNRLSLEADPAFVADTFLPAAIWLWRDVRRARDDAA